MTITSKGQVTIPLKIRTKLGLLPDTEVEFEVVEDWVRVRKAKSSPGGRGASVIRALRGTARSGMSTEEILALTRGDD
jgi:AbrB family looped-hinge helix DNA binding protein